MHSSWLRYFFSTSSSHIQPINKSKNFNRSVSNSPRHSADGCFRGSLGLSLDHEGRLAADKVSHFDCVIGTDKAIFSLGSCLCDMYLMPIFFGIYSAVALLMSSNNTYRLKGDRITDRVFRDMSNCIKGQSC